jgi:hypothetical protein
MRRFSTPVALLAVASTAHAQAPVMNPANGHYYQAVPGTIAWTQAKALAESATFNGAPGHLATVSDASENLFLDAMLGVNTDRYWMGGFQDMSSPSYSEPAGGWTWVTGEPFTYTAWKAGEPNDFGGTEHYLAFDNGPAEWNDAPVDWVFNAGYLIEFESPGTAYCFGDGTASICPCGNPGGSGEGCANSTGAGAVLTASGSTSLAADDLGFDATGLLPAQPALLFVGENAVNGGNGIAFGDGLRCAGLNVVRLGVMLPDAAGAASWGPGLGALGGWSSGDTRYFQAWYRDPIGSPCGAGFNLSNGMEEIFTP